MANSNYRRRSNRISNLESLEERRVLATLAGTVFEDVSDNQVLDDSDPRISGVVIFLDDNNNGVLDQRGFGIDPDEFSEGQVLNRARQTVFPSGTGVDNVPSFQVLSAEDVARASTGQRVFGSADSSDWVNGQRLRFDFTLPVDSASIDVIGSSGLTNANVRFEAFGEDGTLIDSVSRNGIAAGEARQLEIVRPGAVKDVSYVVAYVSSILGAVKFDNLRADDAGSERSTVTSDSGFYRFSDVDDGEVTIAQQTPNGYDQTTPEGSIVVDLAGGIVNRNFGNRTASITGFLFEDLGIIGVQDSTVDQPLEGAGVYLDTNGNGSPDSVSIDIFPDVFLEEQVLDFVSSSVELSTVNADNLPSGQNVIAATDPIASPDSRVFARNGDAAWTNDERFRADFETPASSVQLRFTGGTDAGEERGTLIAFSSTGVAVATVNTRLLGRGESETLSIQRSGGYDIDYVVAYTGTIAPGESVGSGRLDDLRVELVREPVARSGADGVYTFSPLASGSYQVRALPSAARPQSFPEAAVQSVTVEVGDVEEDIDFGFQPDNEPPVARSDFLQTTEDFPVAVGVLVNDTDADGQINEGSVAITQNPLNGTVDVNPNGFIDYTPNDNFFGRDSFLYTVRDDEGAISNAAVVTIDVSPANDAPIAVDDAVSLLPDGSTIIDILGNDTDIDSAIDPASVTIVLSPTNGNVTVDANGLITYTSTNTLDDSFSYTVADAEGAVSNVATVSLAKLTGGIPPVAVDDSATSAEGTLTGIVVTTNDTDADGTIDFNSVFIVSSPVNGSVEIGAAGAVSYQPNLGFIGTDSFTYRVRDNSGLVSNAAQVTFTLTERDFPYQNPINSFDISADGNVSPRDVLLVISEINDPVISDPATGEITATIAAGEQPDAYLDVDGNGLITPRDVLGVITTLNNQSASGEPTAAAADAAVAMLFASQFDALDADDDEELV